jgi:hypothetical protein
MSRLILRCACTEWFQEVRYPLRRDRSRRDRYEHQSFFAFASQRIPARRSPQDGLFAVTAGTFASKPAYQAIPWRRTAMDGIIYLVGLIVIIMFILSFFGLR